MARDFRTERSGVSQEGAKRLTNKETKISKGRPRSKVTEQLYSFGVRIVKVAAFTADGRTGEVEIHYEFME